MTAVRRTLYLFFWVSLCMAPGSCLKNQDDTASGPKASVAMIHLVANAPDLEISIDGDKLQAGAISYGSVTQSNGAVYLQLPAGTHTMGVSGGSEELLDKTILLQANTFYSLFFYDSLRDQSVKALLMADDTATVDTIARVRFLDFIPGTDTLSAILIKDTTGIAITSTYLGNQATEGATFPFGIILKPGTYLLQLRRNNAVIYEQAGYSIAGGKVYSLIARGARNGTGDRKESLAIIQHN